MNQLREDAEEDKKIRDLILGYYDIILSYIKDRVKNKEEVNYEVFVDDKHVGFSFYLNSFFNLPKPLYLVLLPERDNFKGGFGTFKKQPAIILYCLLPYERGVYTYIVERFSSFRGIFLHEMIHYFDKIRMKDPESYKKKNKQDPYGKWDWKKYFNSPNEYNAYFQSLVAYLDDWAKIAKNNEGAREFWKNKVSTWENFYKFATSYSDLKDFFEELTDETKNRLSKRLYQFWIKYMKDVDF